MADESDTPFPALLPDRFRESAKLGSVLLRPETTRSGEGTHDGVWWPRSGDVGAELPGLVTGLTEHLGPVTSLGLDTDAWDDVPARLVVDGRSVHTNWYPVGDDTVIIARGDRDHLTLLVIPPQASLDAAHAVMARTVEAGGTDSARRIPVATGISSEPSGESF